MPFNARLEIDGEDFRVLECEYELTRSIDQFGKPITGIRGGTVKFTIETSGMDLFIVWMASPKMRKSGKIIFEDPTEDSELKVVEFSDAYMVGYKEKFGRENGAAVAGGVDSSGMVETITVSAKKLIVGQAEIENDWPK